MTIDHNQITAEFDARGWDQTADKIEFDFQCNHPPVFKEFSIQPPNILQLVIERDEHYRLNGKLSGQGRFYDVKQFLSCVQDVWEKSKAGTVLKSQTIRFQNHSHDYSISGHFFINSPIPQLVIKNKKLEDCIMRYELSFTVDFVEAHDLGAQPNQNAAPAGPLSRLLIEWCTNAPNNRPGYILRSTKIRSKLEIVTEEEGQTRRVTRYTETGSLDHFRFDFHEFVVRVRFIEVKKHAPYSDKLAIEYYSQDGSSPTVEQRKIVIEFLSFLFGRHVLSVGYSLFESEAEEPDADQLISFRGQNPWGDDLVIVSRLSSHPPIDFERVLVESELEGGAAKLHSPSATIEEFIEQFLPQYEKERRDSGLADLLWGIWTAQSQPTSQRLPIYASSLETVAKTYLKTRQITLEYLSTEQAKAIREALKKAYECIKQLGLPDLTKRAIEGKLSNLNSCGSNERMSRFLSLINLELSDDAKKLRNVSAHGGFSVLAEPDFERQQREVLVENAYRTLLHRVVLRILGYNGQFIDYGSLGFLNQSDDETDGAIEEDSIGDSNTSA